MAELSFASIQVCVQSLYAAQAFGFLAVLPVMLLPRFRELHRAALARQWKGILAVGSFVALNIVLNNLSLVSQRCPQSWPFPYNFSLLHSEKDFHACLTLLNKIVVSHFICVRVIRYQWLGEALLPPALLIETDQSRYDVDAPN